MNNVFANSWNGHGRYANEHGKLNGKTAAANAKKCAKAISAALLTTNHDTAAKP